MCNIFRSVAIIYNFHLEYTCVTEIYFRHDSLRQYQQQLVEDTYSSVKDGCHLLAHAPTGLGKSDAVISATLTYALQNDLTVFFLTPKISQHKIAMEVTNGIAKKHGLKIRAVDLIGRRYACIDKSLSDLDQEGFYLSCEKKRRNETCEFYKRGKGFSKLDEAKANLIFEKVLKEYGVSKTHAELMELGKQHMTCPYEWMIKLAGMSNVIVADYFHLMIPKIRDIFLKKTKKRLDKSIVIIDEAHNLAKRVREQLSSTVNSFIIQRAEKEMRMVGAEKIELFTEFNNWAKGHIKEEKEIAASKGMFNEFISNYGVDKETLAYNLDVIGLEFIERTNKKSMCMKIAKFLRSWDGEEKGSLRILKRRGTGYVLSKRFLDPSVSTSELNKTHSSILMSGTLMPLEMHRDVLGLDEMRTNLRVYRSPFDEDNSLNIICDATTTRYSKRDFDNYKKIAIGVDRLIEATPDSEGIAVFFPSYNVMNSIVPLMKQRKMLIQREKMTPTEVSDILHEFSKGGILCGVQGGSLSEGVDYCKGEIKTTVIVGVALEEPSLETEALIDYYQEKFGKGWEYGYMYPAVIKALQAAGRGIRKESDRSAIVFMDERFKWKNYKSILDDGRRFIITREPEAFVRNFWRGEGVRI